MKINDLRLPNSHNVLWKNICMGQIAQIVEGNKGFFMKMERGDGVNLDDGRVMGQSIMEGPIGKPYEYVILDAELRIMGESS